MKVKATGIVRRMDDLGRVVIPKELRRTLAVGEGDPMEIFMADGGIMLKPYRVSCHCCGESEDLVTVKDVMLCPACIREFAACKDVGEGE